MNRWTPDRLHTIGYTLGAIGAILVAVVATFRPGAGPFLLAGAVILVFAGAVAIGLAQTRKGHT